MDAPQNNESGAIPTNAASPGSNPGLVAEATETGLANTLVETRLVANADASGAKESFLPKIFARFGLRGVPSVGLIIL
jgi:hypothetical protein